MNKKGEIKMNKTIGGKGWTGSRRGFLDGLTAVGAGTILGGCATSGESDDHKSMIPQDNGTRKDMVGKSLGSVLGQKHSGKDSNGIEYENGVKDETTWTRGTDTETTTVDGKSMEVDAGLKIMLPCRHVTDGINGILCFRQFEFDQAGRLVKVGAETENTLVVSAT